MNAHSDTTAPAAPASEALRPELPSERVMRLGKELAKALDDINEQMQHGLTDDDEVQIWVAEIWPSKVYPHVCLAPRDIPVRLARFAGLVS